MLYETRMLERKQAAGKAGYGRGMGHGVRQGRVDSAKTTLKNQMGNGSTLGQVADFIKNLKLVSNKDLEKLIKIYK